MTGTDFLLYVLTFELIIIKIIVLFAIILCPEGLAKWLYMLRRAAGLSQQQQLYMHQAILTIKLTQQDSDFSEIVHVYQA